MKTKRNFLLAAVLALGLLCGCSQTPPTVAQTVPPEPAETQPVTVVQTVDELLEAIAPGAMIELAEGDFDLTTAADYGKETNSPYYSWQPWGDSWILTLDEVDELTIRSTGEVQLLTDTGIVLQNCDNVLLEGFALAVERESAWSDGIRLAGCSDGTLHRVRASEMMLELCNRIKVEACQLELYGSYGIHVSRCQDVEIAQCQSTRGEGAVTPFALYSSRDVLLRDNVVTGSRLASLLDCSQSRGVELRNCQFTDNQIVYRVFDLYDQEPVTMEGCQFSGNRFPQWLSAVPEEESEQVRMQDGAGNPLTEADLHKLQPEQGSLPQQKEVRVHTVDEFLEAIGPDTAIILEEEMYDLSQAEDYGEQSGDYYYWSEEFDGYELIIYNVENFTIRSADGDPKRHTISALPRYADVLSFDGCQYVTLSGFTAGHTKEPGECMGGVLNFTYSTDLTVDNCGLFGCGILGVQTKNCQDVAVKNCDIYECSLGGIDLWYSKNVAIDGCTFRDLGGEEIKCMDCENVTVNGVAQ